MAPVPPRCQPIQDEIEGIRATIRGLQEELRTAPPSQKPAILAMIREERAKETAAERRLDRCIEGAPSSLDVVGVEYTQAIQYFTFNGQGSGQGPANSVPLVAKKPLVIRVYVARQNRNPPFPTSVSGTLTYGRVGGTSFPALSPTGAPIAPRDANDIDRGVLSHTLNFLIPAANCVGTLHFTLKLFDAGTSGIESTHQLNPRTFRDVPSLRIRGVPVRYTGNGLDLAPPSNEDIANSFTFLTRTYPISAIQYTGCDEIAFDGDLTDADSDGWRRLMRVLSNMRSASGTDDIYVAMLPTGTPTNGFKGYGQEGVCAALVGRTILTAHEVGHALGRRHVAGCKDPTNPDPDYPDYDSYPAASIGEFGVDIASLSVKDPASTDDYMSYCEKTRWTSPYTYTGLLNRLSSLAAARDVEDSELRADVRERLFLNIRIRKPATVEWLPSFHLPAHERSGASGRPGRYACDLLGADGDVLASRRLRHTDPHEDDDSARLEFHEVLPWHEDARSIAIRREAEVLGTLAIPPDAPTLRIDREAPVAAGARSGLMRVSWDADETRLRSGGATYLLRYSHDGGTTWRAVAADLTATSRVVNTDVLPGGDRCLFQIVGSNGIRTRTAETTPFPLARKPRQAFLLAPEPGASFRQGAPVVLRGGGFSPDAGMTALDEVSWSSNRDGHLGVGHEVAMHTLSVGKHRIEMTVPDGLGGQASAGVWIEVAPLG